MNPAFSLGEGGGSGTGKQKGEKKTQKIGYRVVVMYGIV
jgi:hypothetical protein